MECLHAVGWYSVSSVSGGKCQINFQPFSQNSAVFFKDIQEISVF